MAESFLASADSSRPPPFTKTKDRSVLYSLASTHRSIIPHDHEGFSLVLHFQSLLTVFSISIIETRGTVYGPVKE